MAVGSRFLPRKLHNDPRQGRDNQSRETKASNGASNESLCFVPETLSCQGAVRTLGGETAVIVKLQDLTRDRFRSSRGSGGKRGVGGFGWRLSLRCRR